MGLPLVVTLRATESFIFSTKTYTKPYYMVFIQIHPNHKGALIQVLTSEDDENVRNSYLFICLYFISPCSR
jgi:hypothetical protein